MRQRTASRGTVEKRGAERGLDTESALRQKMRLHPTGKRISSYPDATSLVAEPEVETEIGEELVAHSRRAIVSINGKDVDEASLMKRKSGRH